MAIDAGDTPDQARALSTREQASVEIVDGVVEEYLAAARRTMDAEAAAEFEQNVRGMYEQMARIAITPHWCATTTSAPAERRDSCRNWPSGTGPDGRATRTPPVGERPITQSVATVRYDRATASPHS